VTVEATALGSAHAVRGVDWRIAEEDFWVTGGLAGSGKTALLETAAGLRPPTAGEVLLFGDRADRFADAQGRATRRRIGFVYAGGGRLLGHLTLAQNVALPLCYHRNCPGEAVAAEVTDWLSRFELLELAERLPGQVNPAGRQRAALVRALVLEPEVMFLDDPLGEMGARQARWWLRWLGGGREARPGLIWPRTWVVATDHLRPWLAVGRQFALLQDGTWRVLGGREHLAEAREPLVRELLAEGQASG